MIITIVPQAGSPDAPEYFRDKVVGWSEVASSLVFIIFNMIAAFASAANADWAAAYVGEALDIYVCPFLSRVLLHNTNPSGGILIAAFGSIIFGILSYPFFKKAYYEAFPEKES